MRRAIASTLCVLAGAAGLAACGSGGSGGSNSSSLTPSGDMVATVGGLPISRTDFNHWLTVAAASAEASAQQGGPVVVPVPPAYKTCIAALRAATPATKGKPAPTQAQLKSECQTEYQSLRQQVMQFLIDADWVIGESGRDHVKLSDKAVQAQVAKLVKQQFHTNAAFNRFLASSHETRDDVLLQLRVNSLTSDLRNRAQHGQGQVSQAAIAAYYDAHRSQYGTPKRRDVRLILTPTRAKALAAKQAITRGTPFAAEARKASTDPATRNNGGLATNVTPGEEEAALSKAVFAAPRNVVQGPVHTPFGWYVFDVTAASPATQQTLAQASTTIRSTLVMQKEQAAVQKFADGFTKRWTALTDCAPTFVVQGCKQFKAPAAGATGTSGSG